MMRRFALVAAALAVPLFLGCSAPTDGGENVGTTTQALGAHGKTFVLTSFDGINQFIGLNDQGKSFIGIYGAQTRFRNARLDKYTPVDPCRDPAARYNSTITINDTVGFNVALTDMVANACLARVHVDKVHSITSFEPVP